ncbi:hypothetical protein JMUB6875_16750 [Nocardia sp. JMUB6875]|uniref:hypothetical protein n=1 Tax=Nocardia sp. JMUB6875 TaxID=3158170 RepID=UPI0032E66EFA
MGDQRAPFKIEIERLHSALASLAEIVAFVMRGLTIQITGHGGITEVAKLFGCTVAPRPAPSPTSSRLRTRPGRGWFRKPVSPEPDC